MIVDIREYLNLIILFRVQYIVRSTTMCLWLRNLCSESLYYTLSWRQTVNMRQYSWGLREGKSESRAQLWGLLLCLASEHSAYWEGDGAAPEGDAWSLLSFKKVWQQKLGRVDVHVPYYIFHSLEVNCPSPALKHPPLSLYILPFILGLVSRSLLTEKILTQLSFWSDRAEDLDSLGTSGILFEEPDTLPEIATFLSLALKSSFNRH